MRRFYDLRDQDVLSDPSTRLRPLERARAAASALVAILSSAADCIRGGLLDPDVGSVIPVDGVLVFLGEALPLLEQEKRVFNKEQVFILLRIVEDFDSVGGRAKENAESLLAASIRAYGQSLGGAGRMRKSRSDLAKSTVSAGGLGGSEWDLLAESVMLGSQERSGRGDGKGKEMEIRRGWDWRKGLQTLGLVEVGRREVVLLVRTALAKEVARGWGGVVMW